jgi:microsomal dipeptidase-like Zn-dependent dipeptidase
MPIFDFHVHPAIKAQISDPANLPTPWDVIKVEFKHPNLITTVLKCQDINEVIDSQASLTQLVNGNVNLIGLILHPVESEMMKARLMRTIADEEQTQYINKSRVRDISTGEFYFIHLNEELKNIKDNLSKDGKRLKIINSMSQYKATDLNTVHAILIIEGPHAFFGMRQGKSEEEIWQEYWENYRSFIGANKIFAMNIAHLQDNEFCCHAFGIQIFDEEPFYPTGFGITENGHTLLRQIERDNIILDIKHMSVLSRKQLYKIMAHEPPNEVAPIICSHSGLTGIHSVRRRQYVNNEIDLPGGFLKIENLKPYGYINGTSFNANSVNLYDDDVIQIIGSGGIIGLSMDQRILGVPADFMLDPNYVGDIYEEDVISPLEVAEYRKINTGTVHDSAILTINDLIDSDDLRDSVAYHAKHFMNQVFHFFKIADDFMIPFEEMATKICIGSDFDGLINPVDGCRDVTKMEKFRDYLITNFKEWEREFTELTRGLKISDKIAPKTLMNNIFYNNAVAFLKDRLK